MVSDSPMEIDDLQSNEVAPQGVQLLGEDRQPNEKTGESAAKDVGLNGIGNPIDDEGQQNTNNKALPPNDVALRGVENIFDEGDQQNRSTENQSSDAPTLGESTLEAFKNIDI